VRCAALGVLAPVVSFMQLMRIDMQEGLQQATHVGPSCSACLQAVQTLLVAAALVVQLVQQSEGAWCRATKSDVSRILI
jgi:bacterioferritin-associated ferredoxin